MSKKIVCFIKYNKLFLKLYQICGNLIVSVLRSFIRIDEKQILFISFGGQKYDDSPRALYEKIKDDPFFADYRLVWSFTDLKQYGNIDCTKIKTDTFSFYKAALSSKVWITNSSVERGLNIKRKGIIEINTWHGTPLKKMGRDIENGKSGLAVRRNSDNTVYCAQSEYDREIFVRLFNTAKENIILSDLPRNDSLLKYDNGSIERLKTNLGIPLYKKVILYAPTFRDYDRDSLNACCIKPPINTGKWRELLSEQYVVLFRAHYEIINVFGIEDDGFFKNVSSYPCLNDLIAVSDILVSDYSSIYFDYSITEKPMFNFSYDYDIYKKLRGLYLDLHEIMPCRVNYDEDSLIEEILSFDEDKYKIASRSFKERFAPHAGNAVETVTEKLKNMLI